MKAAYECLGRLDDVLRRAGELQARTIIFDVEPLVASWDTSQRALDEGLARVLRRTSAVPGLQVVCFSTNSVRRPSAINGGSGPRAIYLASARKPIRTAPYREFPRPGFVVGDQVATDGVLAWRLGYGFLHYQPSHAQVPAGPRLLGYCGQLIRPLLFTPEQDRQR
ncbi:MAG: hypothetical protein ACLPN6_00940 [Streptosporangiaceae bacterium]|nr:hypothetical protein [Actinomycetota bacterium]